MEKNGKLIKKELIFLKKEFKDQGEALKFLADQLLEQGYVKKSFYDALSLRESKYPTGLDTGEVKVAIPHTDAEHVNEACITVMTVKEPIIFKNMADPQEDVPVSLILMLAVKDPQEQVPLLTKLMSIFGEADLLKEIYDAEKVEEIEKILDTVLYEDGIDK